MLPRIHKYLTVPLSIAVLVMVGLAAYWRVSAERAVTNALRAVVDGRPVPVGTQLDILGMQVALQEPARFRALFSHGVDVIEAMYIWDGFPRRTFAFWLAVQQDIGMVCEAYVEGGWRIFCGQLRCVEQPCIFSARPDRLVPYGTTVTTESYRLIEAE